MSLYWKRETVDGILEQAGFNGKPRACLTCKYNIQNTGIDDLEGCVFFRPFAIMVNDGDCCNYWQPSAEVKREDLIYCTIEIVYRSQEVVERVREKKK